MHCKERRRQQLKSYLLNPEHSYRSTAIGCTLLIPALNPNNLSTPDIEEAMLKPNLLQDLQHEAIASEPATKYDSLKVHVPRQYMAPNYLCR